MQTLNLINGAWPSGNNDIFYKIDNFPDGQTNIHLQGIDRKDGHIRIICRITSNDDIVMLMMVQDVLKRQEIIVDSIYITYLLAARMDRVMDLEQPYTLKIVADVINKFNANKVYLLDVHSDKAYDLIKNSEEHRGVMNLDNNNFLKNIQGKVLQYVYPDSGAYKRYSCEMTKYFGAQLVSFISGHYYPFTISHERIYCSKVRDPKTNELSDFVLHNIEKMPIDKGKVTIIVRDDLCDGGGTFVGVGQLIKNYLNGKNIDYQLVLAVTHMIQAKTAIPKLLTYYDEVWFSNSYRFWDRLADEDINNERVKIFDVIAM